MCATNIRPFAIVEGQGFSNLATHFVNLGAKYGSNIDPDGMLPSARSVSRHIGNVALTERQKLIAMLAIEADHEAIFGVTTDMWTHEQTTTPYITVTLHFIDSDWNLHCRILATRSLKEKHTAANIK